MKKEEKINQIKTKVSLKTRIILWISKKIINKYAKPYKVEACLIFITSNF